MYACTYVRAGGRAGVRADVRVMYIVCNYNTHKYNFLKNVTIGFLFFNSDKVMSELKNRNPDKVIHVGEGNRDDENVMGRYSDKARNAEGQMVVDFATRMEMAVLNTYFKKREEHRVTYKSGGRSTQVDYIVCRRAYLKEIGDCKVIAGDNVAKQHRLLVCRMIWRPRSGR